MADETVHYPYVLTSSHPPKTIQRTNRSILLSYIYLVRIELAVHLLVPCYSRT